MIKNLFLTTLLLLSTFVSAQNGSASPYSFYGLGDIKFKGTNDFRQMGGLSVANDSTKLNLLNPATFSTLKITSFAVGANATFSTLENQSSQEKAQRVNIDYLAIGFPLGKFGAAFGVKPFSTVGYKIQNISSDGTSESRIYNGEGGINNAFFGTSYKFNKNFSFGVDLSYNFGEINTESVVFVPNVIYGSREKNTSNVSGITYNLGAFYSYKLKNKGYVSTSFVYTPESDLTLENTRNVAVISYTSTNIEIVIDDADVAVNNTKLKIPTKYTFGIGYGHDRKWFIGAEYVFQENSNMGNRFNDIDNITFEDSKKYIIGGYYTPNFNSFTSYWERITYRAGFRHENTGIVMNNTSINDYGMNFGLGIPVGGRFSNVNVGLEFGKKGSTSNGLIQENYFNLNFGLTLNDLWFEKRKYD